MGFNPGFKGLKYLQLNVFSQQQKIGVTENNCTLYELWNTPGRIMLR
jgi:hypothetical protein